MLTLQLTAPVADNFCGGFHASHELTESLASHHHDDIINTHTGLSLQQASSNLSDNAQMMSL